MKKRKLSGFVAGLKRYTPDEDRIIKAAALSGRSWESVAAELDRSEIAVVTHAYRIGAYRGKSWTAVEDNAIRLGVCNGLRLYEIAKRLGRSYGAVKSRASRIGVTTAFTARENEAIIAAAADNRRYGITRPGRLRMVAEELGRPLYATQKQAQKIGARSYRER